MGDPWELPLLAYLFFNRFIEHHCKAIAVTPDNSPHYAKHPLKGTNRELKVNGLAAIDFPSGADKNTTSADVMD